MPLPLFGHTILQIEDNLFILIGGQDSSWRASAETYLLNGNHNWTKGPSLSEPRYYHTAGVITDQITKKTAVVVVGGLKGIEQPLNSVEMLPLPIEANITKWQPGI